MEAGTVSAVDQNFQHVDFQQPYPEVPLVFTLTGEANTFPSMMRVRNVTSHGFDIAQKEAPNFANGNAAAYDGTTPAEDVSYFAITPGIHRFAGMTFEVGSVSTTAFQAKSGGGQSWETINFDPASFAAKPTLVLQIQTMNNTTGGDNQEDPTLPMLATTVNKGSVDQNGAEIAMERAEATGAGSGTIDNAETLAWLAVTGNQWGSFDPSDGLGSVLFESMTTADSITAWDNLGVDGKIFNFSAPFGATPLAVGSDMSRDGGDGGWLRQRLLSATQIGLVIDEDQFGDTERGHTSELAGVLAVSRAFFHAPEPSTALLALLGAVLAGLLVRRRR